MNYQQFSTWKPDNPGATPNPQAYNNAQDLWNGDNSSSNQSDGNFLSAIPGLMKDVGLGGIVDSFNDQTNNMSQFGKGIGGTLQALFNPPSNQSVEDAPANAAGAASWMLAPGEGLLAKLGLGGLQGGLQGISQKENPLQVGTSALTGAVVNPILGGIGYGLNGLLGKEALGVNGNNVIKLLQEVGGANTIKQLASKTEPIQQAVGDLVDQGSGVPVNNLFGEKVTNPIINSLPTEKKQAAADYLTNLFTDTRANANLPGTTGIDSELSIPSGAVEDLNKQLGIDAYGRDVGNGQRLPSTVPAQKFWPTVRNAVANSTQNPAEYNRLKDLLSTATQIGIKTGGNAADRTSPLSMQSLLKLAQQFSPALLGLGAGGLSHDIVPTLAGGALGLASSNPNIVLPYLNVAASPLGSKVIPGLISRPVENAFSNYSN